jgi:Flp pilus assembly protein TadB
MPRTDDSTAYAANWRAVLAVDAGLGAAVSVVGVVLVVLVSAAVGVVVVAAGFGYLALVAARARRWSRLRRSAPR